MASIQFMGLASNLDTESMVTAMLATHQNKITKVNNEKQKLEWKKECWNDMNKTINKFYTDYVDKLRMQSTFQSYKATSSSTAITVDNSGSLPVGTHKIEVEKLATEISLHGNIEDGIDSKVNSFKDMGLLAEGEETTLKVNNETITVTANMTLSELESQIKKKDESLNVNFDVANHKLFISSKETGTEAKINIDASADTTGLFDRLGLTRLQRKREAGEAGTGDYVDVTVMGKTEMNGTAAVYKYNGVRLESATNEVEVNGLKFTLNEETTEEVTIKVASDPDKIVDFISGFVDAYNTLLNDMTEKYNAASISLDVLTDEEKESMTEKEIEEHEQDIKDSLLRRDDSLKNVIDSLRSSMQVVLGDNYYKALPSIGITTGSYSENGKLYLDKDKLKAALEEDMESVVNLFTASGVDNTGKVDTSKMGIGTRLNNSMQSLFKRVDGARSYQSYYYDIINKNKIEQMSDKIEELQDRYDRMEEIYYAKFTAMEKAIASMNTQSSALTGMIG